MKRTRHLSIHAIAALTGISRKTVTKRVKDFDLEPAGKNGNGNLYRLSDVLPTLLYCGRCRHWWKSHRQHIKKWTEFYNPPVDTVRTSNK